MCSVFLINYKSNDSSFVVICVVNTFNTLIKSPSIPFVSIVEFIVKFKITGSIFHCTFVAGKLD